MRIITYLTGFILSLTLTLAAYFIVTAHVASGHVFLTHHFVMIAALILALAQLIVQMIFFLHLHEETGPRWNLAIFISTIGLVLIIVVGSLWIMNHLNYNMMPAELQAQSTVLNHE